MMQRQSIPAELLADVKNHLNITWDDEATDNKIRGFIAAAMAYLNEKGGSVLDYDADGLPRTLMMEFVRYARDEALDVFENNYMALILNMQNLQVKFSLFYKNTLHIHSNLHLNLGESLQLLHYFLLCYLHHLYF